MIDGRSRTWALLGHPVAHSKSPALHNAWLAELGVDGAYVALDVDPSHADRVVDALRVLPLAGANLTVPFKEVVASRLDACVGLAATLGAANTVVRAPDGSLVGHNTDGDGFVAGLTDAFGDVARGADVVVLGAGGAGLGVGAALAAHGAARVTFLNRSVARAEAAAARVAALAQTAAGPLDAATAAVALRDATLVVQATSGAGADVVRGIDAQAVRPDTVWCDLNYWMADPPLVAALRARGVRTQDGLPMLVHQAALAFRLFTGLTPDVAGALRRIG